MENYDKEYYSTRTFRKPDLALQCILIKDVIQTFTQRPRVLDVGCGIGVYLDFMREHGADSYGIDISRYAASISKQPIASALHLPFKSEIFDAVISAHLIEHLNDLEEVAFLEETKRVLKPGGRLFLLTPNTWYPLQILTGNKLFYDPSHINMHSPHKLKRTVQKCAFSNVTFIFKTSLNILGTHRMKESLKYLPYVIASTTPLAYFRPVIYILAKKPGATTKHRT